MLIGAKKNYRGEEKLQGRRKITGAKKILLKVYQLSGFLDFNTGADAVCSPRNPSLPVIKSDKSDADPPRTRGAGNRRGVPLRAVGARRVPALSVRAT